MSLSSAARRTLALAGVAALAHIATADAAGVACPDDVEAGTHCGTLTVPLDRGGRVPGDVDLTVYRLDATRAATRAPLIALAGGPGQAATPFLADFEYWLAPALRSRDLVVFDERGTGLSGPLRCPSLESEHDARTPRAAVGACARHLGARRAFYTSRDNADDIEAIRQSLGVPKVSLFGVSYGTYTALTYARRYPDRVESLVLDSTVAPGGVDPYDRPTYAAYARVLADICGDDCAAATPDVVATFNHLVAHLRRKRVRTHWFDGHGRRHHFSISELAVRDLLSAGDFSPTLRAELPAALAAADAGDGVLFARLYSGTSSDAYGLRARDDDAPAFDDALYYATHCEEVPVPWTRMAPLAGRQAALTAAVGALPASLFAPFSPSLEAAWGESSECLRWPEGSGESPVVSGPLPDVPALILQGVEDTRTPIANAAEVAALLPQAQVLNVPDTGHSVVGSDLGHCASDAVHSFFGGRRVASCNDSRRLFLPTPLPPASLADVDRRRRVGKSRRTITAVELTLNESAGALDEGVFGGGSVSAGGLRGGYVTASFSRRAFVLAMHRFSYVPGVSVSGWMRVSLAGLSARLTIGGRAAARGRLKLTAAGDLEGELDGKPVRRQLGAASHRPRVSWAMIERLKRPGPARDPAQVRRHRRRAR